MPAETIAKTQKKKKTTRERLVEAAIELLHEGGPAGITTQRLSERAGIVQSGFYRHFRNVDGCLAEAAEAIGELIRREAGLSRSRHDLLNRADHGALEAHFREVLEALQEAPVVLELFVRYRQEPTALGRALGVVYERIVRDVDDYLVTLIAQHAPAGLSPRLNDPDKARIERLARAILAVIFAVAEGEIGSGRGAASEEAAAGDLARMVGALVGSLRG